nr:protein PAIR1 [Ipomoea trifida]
MKLKINKACDLSSISVLPPHARRTSVGPSGTESSVFGKSQASQLRSQQSFSQGFSSQLGIFSQLSQNSPDEIVTNEQRLGSQERENSAKKTSFFPPINCDREESQMQLSRTPTNLMHKWSIPEYKSQMSQELEHRIGVMETSLSRLGMILDSYQNDIMQVNRGTKEILLELESLRQKFVVHDELLHAMIKGQEDLKGSLDGTFKSMSEELKKNVCQEDFREMSSVISALPGKFETFIVKLQNDLSKSLIKEIQAMASSAKVPITEPASIDIPLTEEIKGRAALREMQPLKRQPVHANQQIAPVLKVEMGSWNSVRHEQANVKAISSNERHKEEHLLAIQLEKAQRVITLSDEDIDRGFSCLLTEKELGPGNHSIDDAKDETERILRKARRRKRRHCNTIIID